MLPFVLRVIPTYIPYLQFLFPPCLSHPNSNCQREIGSSCESSQVISDMFALNVPCPSVMGPTGSGKSTVRSFFIHYLWSLDDSRSSSTMLLVKPAKPLAMVCGLAQQIFDLSEYPIPAMATLLSLLTRLALTIHINQIWTS
jgi:hypothetical protein